MFLRECYAVHLSREKPCKKMKCIECNYYSYLFQSVMLNVSTQGDRHYSFSSLQEKHVQIESSIYSQSTPKVEHLSVILWIIENAASSNLQELLQHEAYG